MRAASFCLVALRLFFSYNQNALQFKSRAVDIAVYREEFESCLHKLMLVKLSDVERIATKKFRPSKSVVNAIKSREEQKKLQGCVGKRETEEFTL